MPMNSGGLLMYHLRRVGPAPQRDGNQNHMCFHKTCSVIGRRAALVDFVLNSANREQNAIISRCHAKVVRDEVNRHEIIDSSRNGIFINDVKIKERQILREGDTVTFGHRNGENIAPGIHERQPNSEHQFVFERCTCAHTSLHMPASNPIQSSEVQLRASPLDCVLASGYQPQVSSTPRNAHRRPFQEQQNRQSIRGSSNNPSSLKILKQEASQTLTFPESGSPHQTIQVQNVSRDGSYIGTGTAGVAHIAEKDSAEDSYDTVDAAENHQPLNLSTKDDMPSADNLIETSVLRSQSSVGSRAAFGSAKQMNAALSKVYIERNSTPAVTFESSVVKEEFFVKPTTSDHFYISNELEESKLFDSSSHTGNPGPIYMPNSAEHHPPIKSTLMKTDTVKSSRSPCGSVLLQRRRSHTYVDSAARYTPSPSKGSPSPVKDRVLQLEQRSPAKEEMATPPGMPSRTKVKKLAAQLVAAVQGTPTNSPQKFSIKAPQTMQIDSCDGIPVSKLHGESFESTLNLHVTSPRFHQKAVCVVEVTSPIKILKAQCLSEVSDDSVVEDTATAILSSTEKRSGKMSEALPDYNFVFSEPMPVDVVHDDNSDCESLKTVEEEIITKTVASEANNSYVSSTHDHSMVSDTTFDDSRNSYDKPCGKSNGRPVVESFTDESSLPEEDWGQESGIENLSDLKINVSDSKLTPVIEDNTCAEQSGAEGSMLSESEDEEVLSEPIDETSDAANVEVMAEHKASREDETHLPNETTPEENGAPDDSDQPESAAEDDNVEAAAPCSEELRGEVSHVQDEDWSDEDSHTAKDPEDGSTEQNVSSHSEGFIVTEDADACAPPNNNSVQDLDFPPRGQNSADNVLATNRSDAVGIAFENPEVELELSGGWESEAGHEDSTCASDQTWDTRNSSARADDSGHEVNDMESEGWASDLEAAEHERRASVEKVHDNSGRLHTSDCSESLPNESVGERKEISKMEEMAAEQDVVVKTLTDYISPAHQKEEDSLSESELENRSSHADSNPCVPQSLDGSVLMKVQDRLTPNTTCDISASDQSASLDADYYDSDTPNTSNVNFETSHQGKPHAMNSNPEEIQAAVGDLQQSGSSVGRGSLLEPIDEEFIDGHTHPTNSSDEEEDDEDPLNLYLPSSQETCAGDQISAKLDHIESILIAQAGEQSPMPCATSDTDELSEPGSPVFKADATVSAVQGEASEDVKVLHSNRSNEQNDSAIDDHSDTEASSEEEETESKSSGVFQIRPSDSLEFLADLPEEGAHEDPENKDNRGDENVSETVDDYKLHQPVKRKFPDRVKVSETSSEGEVNSVHSMTKRRKTEEDVKPLDRILSTITEDDEDVSFQDSADDTGEEVSSNDYLDVKMATSNLSHKTAYYAVSSEQDEFDSEDFESNLPTDDQVQQNVESAKLPSSCTGADVSTLDDYMEEGVVDTATTQQIDALSLRVEVGDDVARLSDIVSENSEMTYQSEITNDGAIDEETIDMSVLSDLATEANMTESESNGVVVLPNHTESLCPEVVSNLNEKEGSLDASVPETHQAQWDEAQERVTQATTTTIPDHSQVSEVVEENQGLDTADNFTDPQEEQTADVAYFEPHLASGKACDRNTEFAAENISEPHSNTIGTLAEMSQKVVQANEMSENMMFAIGKSSSEVNFTHLTAGENSESCVEAKEHLPLEATESEEPDTPTEQAETEQEEVSCVEQIQNDTAEVTKETENYVEDEDVAESVEVPNQGILRESAGWSTEYATVSVRSDITAEETNIIADQALHQADDSEVMEQEMSASDQTGREATFSPENLTDKPLAEAIDVLPEEMDPQTGELTTELSGNPENGSVNYTVTDTMGSECVLSQENSCIGQLENISSCEPNVNEEISQTTSADGGQRHLCHSPETVLHNEENETAQNIAENDENAVEERTVEVPVEAASKVQKETEETRTPEEVLPDVELSNDMEPSPEPDESSFSETPESTDNNGTDLGAVEAQAPEVVVSDENVSSVSITPPIETETADGVAEIAENTELESVPKINLCQPATRVVEQNTCNVIDEVLPAKIAKPASCSKKAVGAKELSYCTEFKAKPSLHVSNVCEVVERVSPQKTSPIRKGIDSPVTTEVQEQFADALPGADSHSIEVQNDTLGATQQNDAITNKHAMTDEVNDEKEESAPDAPDDSLEQNETSTSSSEKMVRMREADCFGLPSPPKRRRVQSDDDLPVNDDAAIAIIQPSHDNSIDVQLTSTPICDLDEPILSTQALSEVQSRPIDELDEPIMSTQALGLVSGDGSHELDDTLTEDSLELALFDSQTDGISDSGSNKENIPPALQECENLDDTASIDAMLDESRQQNESFQDTESNLDSERIEDGLDETVSELGSSQERPLVLLDDTETESGSDSGGEADLVAQSSAAAEEPILSTQELDVVLVPDKLQKDPSSIAVVSEKRARHISTEEPPGKRNRPSLDDPILSTQDLHRQSSDLHEVESISTQDSVQVIDDVTAVEATSSSDLQILEDDVAEMEEDEDKENRPPPDFMDMPNQAEKSDSEDIIVPSDDAVDAASTSLVLHQPEEEYQVQMSLDASPQQVVRNQDQDSLIDSKRSDTDSDIKEIDIVCSVPENSRLGNQRENPVESDNSSDDSDCIIEVTSEGIAVRTLDSNIEKQAARTLPDKLELIQIKQEVDPDTIEPDVMEDVGDNGQNLESVEILTKVDKNMSSPADTDKDIHRNAVLSYIGKTIQSAKETFLGTSQGKKSAVAEPMDNRLGRCANEQGPKTLQDEKQDDESVVSENNVYNSDQLMLSESEIKSELVSPLAVSMDGVMDDGKPEQGRGLIIADVKSLTESVQEGKQIPGKYGEEDITKSTCAVTPAAIVPDEGSSVDPSPSSTGAGAEDGGQFDDADSDDSIAYYQPPPKVKRSPKVKTLRTRSCRSMPYERPNRLGSTPLPVGLRRPVVSTGRSIIQQSVSEARTWSSQFSSDSPMRSAPERPMSLSLMVQQIKCESPQSLSLPAWNVTISEEDEILANASTIHSQEQAATQVTDAGPTSTVNTTNNSVVSESQDLPDEPGSADHNDSPKINKSKDVESPTLPQNSSHVGLPYVNELCALSNGTKVIDASFDQSNDHLESSQEIDLQYAIPQETISEPEENSQQTPRSNVNHMDQRLPTNYQHKNPNIDTNEPEDIIHPDKANASRATEVAKKHCVQINVIEPSSIVSSKSSKTQGDDRPENPTVTVANQHTVADTFSSQSMAALFDDGDQEDFSAPPLNLDSLYTPKKNKPVRRLSDSSLLPSCKPSDTDTESEVLPSVSQIPNKKRSSTGTIDRPSHLDSYNNQEILFSSKRAKVIENEKTVSDRKRMLQSAASESDTDSIYPVKEKKKRLSATMPENVPARCEDTPPNYDTGTVTIKQEPMFLSQTQERLEKAKSLIIKKEELDEEMSVGSPVEASIFALPDSDKDDDEKSQKSYKGSGNVNIDNAQGFVERVLKIMDRLKDLISSKKGESAMGRAKKWLDVIEDLRKYAELPETIVAVVGNTGAGKSSLLNALLDHYDILPTSSMQACTAAVVEISGNKKDELYRADVEFLSKEEWYSELKTLLDELTGTDGMVKCRKPPSDSSSAVAFSKITAVYGNFDTGVTLDNFKNKIRINDMLGNTKKVEDLKPERFKRRLDVFIEARDSISGGQFWPLVKQVKLYIPECNVCSTGAKLVDLPGVRDSNAARDQVARDFIKKCTAVWVVADITRAVDDKTARDLLGEHFRRQLLMDGRYGALSFVCTKTDVLKASEMRRVLPNETSGCETLEEEIDALEEELDTVKKQGRELEEEVLQLQSKLQGEKDDLDELRDAIQVLETKLESPDKPEDFPVALFEEALQKAEEKRNSIEADLKRFREFKSRLKDRKSRLQDIEKKISEKSRMINVICSNARSKYSKVRIKKDFKAGLRAMKRIAGINADDEEDEMADDYDSDADDEDVRKTADKLKVFCVSSSEFLKLRFPKKSKDGAPTCFTTKEETGIPNLRKFVQDLTQVRRLQAAERLIARMTHSVCDMQAYLTDTGTKEVSTRNSCKATIMTRIEELQGQITKERLKKLQQVIDKVFEEKLNEKITKGAGKAKISAEATARRWGERQNKEKPKEGGLHFSTYRATIRRDGQFKSPACGEIDFNEDLAAPMMSTISFTWDRVFSDELWKLLDEFVKDALNQIQGFCKKVTTEVVALGISQHRINKINQQVMSHAKQKLTDVSRILKELIVTNQREITRLVTPLVQDYMIPGYERASAEVGSGCFVRMKDHINNHTAEKKKPMFHSAAMTLKRQLMKLQDELSVQLQETMTNMMKNIAEIYEPFWEAPAQLQQIQKAYKTGVQEVLQTVEELCKEADLEEVNEMLATRAINVTPVIEEVTRVQNTGQRIQIPSATATLAILSQPRREVDLRKITLPNSTSLITPQISTSARGPSMGGATVSKKSKAMRGKASDEFAILANSSCNIPYLTSVNINDTSFRIINTDPRIVDSNTANTRHIPGHIPEKTSKTDGCPKPETLLVVYPASGTEMSGHESLGSTVASENSGTTYRQTCPQVQHRSAMYQNRQTCSAVKQESTMNQNRQACSAVKQESTMYQNRPPRVQQGSIVYQHGQTCSAVKQESTMYQNRPPRVQQGSIVYQNRQTCSAVKQESIMYQIRPTCLQVQQGSTTYQNRPTCHRVQQGSTTYQNRATFPQVQQGATMYQNRLIMSKDNQPVGSHMDNADRMGSNGPLRRDPSTFPPSNDVPPRRTPSLTNTTRQIILDQLMKDWSEDSD